MKYFTLFFLVISSLACYAQKYLAKKSTVTFFSDALIEDITASTTKANGIIDVSKQEFAFSVPIKEFQFQKSLMKEHFNEKYMETEKYPKATFTGKMENFDPNADKQEVTASGKLSIHGVTKDVRIPSTMEKQNSGYHVASKFMVKLEDYKITIPQLLFQNIAEEVEVTVDFDFVAQ